MLLRQILILLQECSCKREKIKIDPPKRPEDLYSAVFDMQDIRTAALGKLHIVSDDKDRDVLNSPGGSFTPALNKRAVDALLRHKLFVRALLGYPARFYNDYVICFAHSLEPVGYHYDSFFSGERFDRTDKLGFIFGIDICGSFIKHDYRSILHYSTGNRYTLLFTARKRCAALTDDGIIFVGELHYKIVAARFFCRLDDLFHRSFGLAETDIVGYGILKEIYTLENKAEILHQRIHAVSAHICAAELYRA